MKSRRLLWGLLASGALSQNALAAEPTLLHWGEENWRVESEPSSPPSITRQEADGSLYLQARKGMTIWLLRPLSGSYTLSFERTILTSSPSCRLSDMNFFWAAHEQNNALPYIRDGALASYNNLILFYAGIGGNTNTTTRFRWYDGSGKRQLLQESTQEKDLLRADHTYHITLTVSKETSTFLIDGKTVFSQTATPTPAGYFGIRTVGSCQKLNNFTLRWD